MAYKQTNSEFEIRWDPMYGYQRAENIYGL